MFPLNGRYCKVLIIEIRTICATRFYWKVFLCHRCPGNRQRLWKTYKNVYQFYAGKLRITLTAKVWRSNWLSLRCIQFIRFPGCHRGASFCTCFTWKSRLWSYVFESSKSKVINRSDWNLKSQNHLFTNVISSHKKVCNGEKHIALPQILLEQQQAT